MPRFNLLPTIALMVMLLVTSGCRIHSDSHKDFSAQAPRSYAEAESTAMGTTGSAIGESAPSSVMAPSSSADATPQQAGPSFTPQIIKTVTVSLKVERLATTIKVLDPLIRQYDGLVTNESLNLNPDGNGYRTGSLEVRIPQPQLPAFLEALAKTGVVLSQQITGRDVSAEIVDNDSRIRNLKAEEAALQQIMHRAGKIPEILEVSRELSRVRGEIEQLQGRVNYLRQQVAYSTVTIWVTEQNLASPDQAKPTIANVLSTAFKRSLGALYDVTLSLLDLGVWLLVFVLPIALVIGFVLFLVGKSLRPVYQKATTALKHRLKPTKPFDK